MFPALPRDWRGFSYLGGHDSASPVKKTKIAVFIDWQNVYNHAREAFGYRDQLPSIGSVSPLRIGQSLAAGAGRGAWGELVRVEVHRGLPAPRRQAVANKATIRQVRAWQKESELVHAVLQNLRYRTVAGEMVAEEKGVDVRLAINAVELMVDGRADLAIIFSHDTDLLPVVDVISRLRGSDCVETASWVSESHRKQLPPRPGVVNHALDHSVFRGAQDSTNYASKSYVAI